MIANKMNEAVKLVQRARSCFGYCDHHKEATEEVTYRYKGCWGCPHFEFGKTFPYVFVSEVAEKLKVSESTVRIDQEREAGRRTVRAAKENRVASVTLHIFQKKV
jgi:hypothetical protein